MEARVLCAIFTPPAHYCQGAGACAYCKFMTRSQQMFSEACLQGLKLSYGSRKIIRSVCNWATRLVSVTPKWFCSRCFQAFWRWHAFYVLSCLQHYVFFWQLNWVACKLTAAVCGFFYLIQTNFADSRDLNICLSNWPCLKVRRTQLIGIFKPQENVLEPFHY